MGTDQSGFDIDYPTYPDFSDLITEEDYSKYFDGHSCTYRDVLDFAIFRQLEKITEKVSRKW